MDTPDTVLLFDIDGTLTDPREPLVRTMSDALGNLSVPFHVAAGSNMDLVEPQFLELLYEHGFRKDFHAFVNNGSTHYFCPFSDSYKLELVEAFDFEKHLGTDDFNWLMSELAAAMELPEFALGEGVQVMGDQVKSRGSMVNFSPSGRPAAGVLSEEALANRKAFVAFDKANLYRAKLVDFLKSKVARLIDEKDLKIMLGGETSFDIVIDGQDKTASVRWCLERGFKNIVFVGDALFPGGNDSVITDWISKWSGEGTCPVEAIQVDGWKDTLCKLEARGWLPK